MLQLLVLGLAGLLVGAAIGARKNSAPGWLAALFLALAVVALVVAVALLVTSDHP